MSVNFKYDGTIVILDAGHGINTKGKCSPDGRLREYKWARDIVDLLIVELSKYEINTYKLVPEETDISLKTRCNRVNNICKNKKAILISIHLNAAGADGKWHNASGWSGWVSSKNASKNSKRLAKLLCEEALKNNLLGNRCIPPHKYWEGNFAIVRDTNCPAVLTENLFQDNAQDVEILLSEEGKQKIINLHVNAIIRYLNGE